jgi:16S rRNA (cytosine1402-N4)-methyltransferase
LAASAPWEHQTVLLNEACASLVTRPNGLYIDATFGRGGHSRAILQRLSPEGRLLAFDRDPEAIEAARALMDTRFSIQHRPFSEFAQALDELGIQEVDGILADLGVSSPQLDQAERGFSFLRDGPLDMRMDPSQGMSAMEWLNLATPEEIEEVIRDYGEERHARAIAGAIVARREAAPSEQLPPLERTGQLAELVEKTLRRLGRAREPGHHPATRTFQALRIYVNAELAELDALLAQAPSRLRAGGRLACISFHSLEDRRVKQRFQALSRPQRLARPAGLGRAQFALLQAGHLPDGPEEPRFRVCGRERASSAESAINPRARSAILRVLERC